MITTPNFENRRRAKAIAIRLRNFGIHSSDKADYDRRPPTRKELGWAFRELNHPRGRW